MSQVSIIDIEGNNPQIPTRFNGNVGFAIPIANTLEIVATMVPAGAIPIQTVASGNTVETQLQYSQAVAASDPNTVGAASFDSASFNVDANGFVTFVGSTFDGLTPDDGAQVVAVAGNINVFGQKALVAPVMTTHNVGGNFLIENRAWETQYVVDTSTTVGLQGTYSTVQAAINQAVIDGATLTNEKMIYVRYGTYIENLTIPPGIFLKGDAMVEQPGSIPLFTEIRGNHTFGDANLFRCENIYFTNVDATADMFSPATIIIVNATNCVFNNGNSTGVIFTLDFGFQHFTNCIFYGNPYQPVLDLINSGTTTFERCSFPQSSAINNTQLIRFYDCLTVGPVICTNGQIIGRNTVFNGDVNCITGNGSSLQLWNCTFNSSSDSIDYTGLVALSSCSLATSGGGQNLYAAAQLRGVIPTLAGQIFMHEETAINTTMGEQHVLYVDCTSGPVTITLPYAITIDRTYIVKDWKGQSQLNNITVVVGFPGGTIEGAASMVIDDPYQSVCFQKTSDAGEYIVLWNNTGEFAVTTSNTNKQFTKSGHTYNINFGGSNLLIGSNGSITSGGANTAFGGSALAATTVGGSNVAMGNAALASNTAGGSNVAIGAQAMSTYNVTGVAAMTSNTAVGTNALQMLSTGTYNTVYGNNAGLNYTSTESNNILIRHRGVVGESNTIRIGTPGSGAGQVNRAFMAGITAVTVAASSPVGVDTNGQLSDLGFGTATEVFTSNGPGASPTWQSSAASLITTYTASGSWTKNAKTKTVRFLAWGGGGGGGSGRCGASATAGGGGGGGGGGFYDMVFNGADLTASPYTVTIGTGGTGGASINAVTTNGNPGNPGTNTTLGSVVLATGSPGGAGGTTGSATGGAPSYLSISGITTSVATGTAGNSIATNPGTNLQNSYASGGGGGSGYQAATPRIGGAAGSIVDQALNIIVTGGAGGANTGATAGNGNSPSGQSLSIGGTGGGGGGHNGTTTAGTGGNGAFPGGGGGGGAGNLSSNPSGAGGNGANGYLIVIEYF